MASEAEAGSESESAVAANTERITLGSGGVMLPNHSPQVIAEQFGTLATLHPGRIELGLGRAPGTDQPTVAALRRDAATEVRIEEGTGIEVLTGLGAGTRC